MMTQASDKMRVKIIAAIRKVAYRADQHDSTTSYLDNFVQIVDFEKLSTANNEILFGRNGTGKTHLMRAFEQHCYANFDAAKVLPVYIDCRLLDVRSLGKEISLERLLTIFYKRLVRKILTDLKQFSEQVITVGMLERLFGGQGRDRRNRIDASLKSLDRLLDEGEIDESVKSYIRKVENERDASAKISSHLSFSAKVSEKGAGGGAKAKGDSSGDIAWKSKKNLETIYNGLAVIDYDQIHFHLATIIENAGAKSVIVLIDEWSDLPRDMQPLIAEMIRKTLGTSNIVNLKIAALKFFCWPSAVIEDGQPIGLTRANLNVLADLDALLCFEAQSQAIKNFMTTMLYKHIVALDSDLNNMAVVAFENILCTEVFDGDAAYQELIRSSEGNPRDFLRLLANCLNSGKLEEGRPIAERAVLKAAIDHFQNDKRPEIAHNEKLTVTFDKLFQLVIRNGSKLFAVSSTIAEQSVALRELWHYRFIHLVQQNLPIFGDNAVGEYDIYAIDYGKLLSLKLTKKGEEQFGKIQLLTELLSKVLPVGELMNLIEIILKTELVGGSLRKMLGRIAVTEQGVERGNFDGIEQLISAGCVADEILSAVTMKSRPRSKVANGNAIRQK